MTRTYKTKAEREEMVQEMYGGLIEACEFIRSSVDPFMDDASFQTITRVYEQVSEARAEVARIVDNPPAAETEG